MKLLLTALVMTMLTGCAGEFDLFADPERTQASFPGAEVGEDGKIKTPGTDPGTTVETETLEPGFVLEKQEVRLLPFHVRMEKLSRVTGLPTEDPLFDEIWRNRYDLGDHNYAQGIGADLSWNATKMSVWVRAIQPICNSEAMASRYPALPEHLNELVTEAYGREATMEDLEIFEDAIAEEQLADAERYQAVCIAVLTSSEFVAI